MLRAELAESEPLPYFGRHYWLAANPLLYYTERLLDRSSGSAQEAIRTARSRQARLLLCARSLLPEVLHQGVRYEILLGNRDWVLLRLAPA